MKWLNRWLGKKEIATVSTAVAALRREYAGQPLTEESAGDDPVAFFGKWFSEAVELSKYDPNAMVLSTCVDGKPSGRLVLLKGFDQRGFVFFTNYDSRKSKEIQENPNVALTFNWPELFRQLRIEGVAEPVSAEESDDYFNSRPRESNYSAMASPQSSEIESREELEKRLEEVKNQWSRKEKLERPDNWGGYRVKPALIEFWQGRTNRLHDRIRFNKVNGAWQKKRLAP